jgi:hypothetical protein
MTDDENRPVRIDRPPIRRSDQARVGKFRCHSRPGAPQNWPGRIRPPFWTFLVGLRFPWKSSTSACVACQRATDRRKSDRRPWVTLKQNAFVHHRAAWVMPPAWRRRSVGPQPRNFWPSSDRLEDSWLFDERCPGDSVRRVRASRSDQAFGPRRCRAAQVAAQTQRDLRPMRVSPLALLTPPDIGVGARKRRACNGLFRTGSLGLTRRFRGFEPHSQ